MCTIRLISKFSNNTIIDVRLHFDDININLIDMPAYAIYTNDNTNHNIEFIFTSSKEERARLNFKDILIEYGVNSGRIYILQTNKENINQTDKYNIIEESKTINSTERFKENIINFISLCNQTIEYIINNINQYQKK